MPIPKREKKVRAYAVLETTGKILFVGSCDMDTMNLNHLEIFPQKRDVNKVAKDPDLGTHLDVVPVEITYSLPSKPKRRGK